MRILTLALGLGLALPAFGNEACQETQVFDPLHQLKTIKALPKVLPKMEAVELPTLSTIEAPKIEVEMLTLGVAFETRFPKLRAPRTNSRELVLYPKPGEVRGLAEGTFPALYLSGKTGDGTWKKRKETSVSVEKFGNYYSIRVRFNKKPKTDSVFAIEFNGNSKVFLDYRTLSQAKKVRGASLLKKMREDGYKSLYAEFPKERSFLAKVAGPTIQLFPQAGISLLAGNPLPLGYAVFNMTARRATLRHATKEKIDRQQEQIQMLEQELVGLRSQLAQLQQNGNQQTLAQRQ